MEKVTGSDKYRSGRGTLRFTASQHVGSRDAVWLEEPVQHKCVVAQQLLQRKLAERQQRPV